MTVQTRFIQMHKIHSFAGARLNTDESGQNKKLPYGGSMRTRVSSQAIKRRLKTANDRYALSNVGLPHGSRSRVTIERRIMEDISAETDEEREVADQIALAFSHCLHGPNADTVHGRQSILLGEPEMKFLKSHAERIYEESEGDIKVAVEQVNAIFQSSSLDERRNIRAFRNSIKLPAGIEAALFGRMMTSDNTANIDAAVYVAHAFTTHAEESEFDYFTAVDELLTSSESGSAHVNENELASSLFYSYAVIDVPRLVSNAEGVAPEDYMNADRDHVANVVNHLIHLFPTIPMGGAWGSTAPFSYADFMLVEIGDRQPRSLAGAYRTPTRPRIRESLDAMKRYIERLDQVYESDEKRRYNALDDVEIPRAEFLNLNALADWVARSIRDGKAT